MNASTDPSARAVVERFFAANRALDVDGMFEEIGTEARWLFPAAPQGAPRQVVGKARNRAFFESLRPIWRDFDLTFVEVEPLSDGKIVEWIEFCDPAPLERGVAVLLASAAAR